MAGQPVGQPFISGDFSKVAVPALRPSSALSRLVFSRGL
jgi:hypothetical protein